MLLFAAAATQRRPGYTIVANGEGTPATITVPYISIPQKIRYGHATERPTNGRVTKATVYTFNC